MILVNLISPTEGVGRQILAVKPPFSIPDDHKDRGASGILVDGPSFVHPIKLKRQCVLMHASNGYFVKRAIYTRLGTFTGMWSEIYVLVLENEQKNGGRISPF